MKIFDYYKKLLRKNHDYYKKLFGKIHKKSYKNLFQQKKIKFKNSLKLLLNFMKKLFFFLYLKKYI